MWILRFLKRDKKLDINSIKEAIDNLPIGVCFFDNRGALRLCNKKMYEIGYDLLKRDIQYLDSFKQSLNQEDELVKDHILSDHRVYRVSFNKIEGGFTEVVALDVSELFYTSEELSRETKALKEIANRLERLSKNVLVLTREEEVLNMKIRLHDEIGKGIVATRWTLKNNLPTDSLDLELWEDAIDFLRKNNKEVKRESPLSELKKVSKAIGVDIKMEGKLPKDEEAAYIIVTALRECVTNTKRHSGGDEVYIEIQEEPLKIEITNNGKKPEEEIVEGGGLSNLREKVEKQGGRMRVYSSPEFKLEITI